MNKYTIQERQEEIDRLYPDFQDEGLQEKFREYKREVSKILGKPEDNRRISYGFNACLKMISTATDIDWNEVKWNGLESSMVSWYSAATAHERNRNKEVIQELKDIVMAHKCALEYDYVPDKSSVDDIIRDIYPFEKQKLEEVLTKYKGYSSWNLMDEILLNIEKL